MHETSIQAWKDPAFRASLDSDAIAALPAHPAGPAWATLGAPQVQQIIGAVPGSEVDAFAESSGYICTYTTETCFCCEAG